MPGIAVVGMHRGGTSAVAKIVYELGAYMGDNLLPPSEHNPQGYYEDSGVVDFHTGVIGGNWHKPVMNRSVLYAGRYKGLLKPFMKHDFWAIKDPRLCFVLPLLLSVVPDIRVIAVYRDPFKAARSLSKRNNLAYVTALEISIAYLGKMIENTSGIGPLWVNYTDTVLYPDVAAIAIANFAGVEHNTKAASAIDRSLAHWEVEEAKSISRIIGGIKD